MSKSSHLADLISPLQFELAMNIGRELELVPMLEAFIQPLLSRLEGMEAYVWLGWGAKVTRIAYPVQSSMTAVEAKISALEGQSQGALRSGDSFQIDEAYVHIFRMGKAGFFALKREQPLSKAFAVALFPIMERLAQACQQCLFYQHQLLQKQTSVKALGKAIRDCDFKDELIASLRSKILAPVEEAIDLQARVLEDGGEFSQDLTPILCNGIQLIADELEQFVHLQEPDAELYLQPLKLNDLLEQVVEENEERARLKNIELSFFMEENIAPCVLGDSSRLKLILQQLIDNALRHTEKGSVRITVAAAGVEPDQIKFEVSDTGKGVVSTKLENLLELDPHSDRFTLNDEGKGLRLSIINQTLAAMGSHLAAKSVLGMGSVFSFELNMRTSSDEQKNPSSWCDGEESNVSEIKPKLKALVCEDNAVNRMVAQKMLEKMGYEVFSAANGVEGLKVWEACRPDLILMDIEMPVMDGMKATECIREREEKLNIRVPVIGLMAKVDKNLETKCQSIGVNNFLCKPFTPKILAHIITIAQEIHQQHSIFDQTVNL